MSILSVLKCNFFTQRAIDVTEIRWNENSLSVVASGHRQAHSLSTINFNGLSTLASMSTNSAATFW